MSAIQRCNKNKNRLIIAIIMKWTSSFARKIVVEKSIQNSLFKTRSQIHRNIISNISHSSCSLFWISICLLLQRHVKRHYENKKNEKNKKKNDNLNNCSLKNNLFNNQNFFFLISTISTFLLFIVTHFKSTNNFLLYFENLNTSSTIRTKWYDITTNCTLSYRDFAVKILSFSIVHYSMWLSMSLRWTRIRYFKSNSLNKSCRKSKLNENSNFFVIDDVLKNKL